MPRNRVRKTERATNLDGLSSAAKLVETGKSSVKAAAAEHGVARTTLQRFLKCSPTKRGCYGYINCHTKASIFTDEMENELAAHVKDLDNRFHGLTPIKVRELAHEYGAANGVKMPANWIKDQAAGTLTAHYRFE